MSYELYTTKHWMVLPSFVHGILPTLIYNTNNHVVLGVMDKKRPFLAVAGGSDYIRDAQVTKDGEVIPRYDGWGENLFAQMKEPFVNLIPIDGPITRNGDACSYGSKDIRDWMMEAADNEYCQAHILIVNTPGGSAWAKNDFKQAIDYAHSLGQRVYMLIDGLCASAGMYLASFCDEVYVVNLKDQLGCVGVMASFFTLKNGDKNQFDSETYHEYYATKSINKNKEIRDIAENDDATLLIAELDELEAEFRADMQKSFPNATDEHLDGKVFDADEVMGILCDGQMMLGELVGRAFDVAEGSEEPIERTASRNIGKPAGSSNGGSKREAHVSPKNNSIMNNKYQNIAQILGVEELQVTEEGTFLNTPLLDTLDEKLAEMQEKVAQAEANAADPEPEPAADPAPAADPEPEPAADPEPEPEPAPEPSQEADPEPAADPEPEPEPAPAADPDPEPAPAADPEPSQEAIENAQEDIDKIQETLHTAEATIAERDSKIEELSQKIAELTTGIDGHKATAEQLQADLDGARADIEKANGTIAERDKEIENLKKQVADLQAEVKEMAGSPAPMTNGDSGIPAGNGTGDKPKQNRHQRIQRGMSYEQIREAMKEE